MLVAILSVVGASVATGAAQSGATRACALLTRELILRVTPLSGRARDVGLAIPPEGGALGSAGSECTYGGVTLQLDPFPWSTVTREQLTPVGGVGDAAFFRSNRDEYAELFVRSGAHVITIQMDVPTGKSAASIQSNAVALAKELLPQIK